MDHLEAEHDTIVLVGDIFQTDHGVMPGKAAAARELRRARQRMPGLTARLDGYRYVHGNHDLIARDELGAQELIRMEADGMSLVFTHGHQFDPLFHMSYPIPQLGTWLTGQMRTVGLGAVAQAIEDKDIDLKHRRFHRPGGPYLEAAAVIMAREKADAVVMGHTHVAVKQSVGPGVSVNTGSCSRGQHSWASIDTATRAVEVHRVFRDALPRAG